MPEAESVLNQGLLKGFAASKPPGTTTRGGVDFRVLDQKFPDGAHYHDEWIAGRIGGGQETVVTPQGEYTRLYAGGTFFEEVLEPLGTDKAHVQSALSAFLKGSEGKTRLGENYHAEDGIWEYDYRVGEGIKEIDLITGMEIIKFKGESVFAHAIIISPAIK